MLNKQLKGVMQPSTVFEWDPRDFDSLRKSCDTDPATEHILKYMPRDGAILEAGCGLARFVQYLSDQGFESVLGLEINGDALRAVKAMASELELIHGDVSQLCLRDDCIAGVISLGVVEHFIEGPEKPLREMLRVLKPGGYGVITVPCMNSIRKVRYAFHIHKPTYRMRKASSKILTTESSEPPDARRDCGSDVCNYRFKPWLRSGDFFEYRFTKREFEQELKKAGFALVYSVPVGFWEGIYMDLLPVFEYLKKKRGFFMTVLCKLLERSLSFGIAIISGFSPFKGSYMHNHMLLCVVRKV
ncbi:MAG: methyltransferase domain-containing protein [Nitrososphaerota archaeon]|nr:methyltransferase domain-containing protein [Nitrososphaerota archaeon]